MPSHQESSQSPSFWGEDRRSVESSSAQESDPVARSLAASEDMDILSQLTSSLLTVASSEEHLLAPHDAHYLPYVPLDTDLQEHLLLMSPSTLNDYQIEPSDTKNQMDDLTNPLALADDTVNSAGASQSVQQSPERQVELPFPRKRSREPEIDLDMGRRVVSRSSGLTSIGDGANVIDATPDVTTSQPTPRAVVTVPQRTYRPGNSSEHLLADPKRTVIFNSQNPRGEGISLSKALARQFDDLEDAGGSVLEDVDSVTATFRIEWPGYPSWHRQFNTKNWKKTRTPLIRRDLAHRIAHLVNAFLKEYQGVDVSSPDYITWNIGPDGIKIEDLILISLYNVSTGSWQAELRVIRN
ncbi:hypothetical protein BJ138DRAFT_1116531 [Hygrophoropsis aurantiaca]|uniref:Uncharacterized protein n=1 Tax=Hygrophoropsis aurantiaca TaxID=72124 RepID=A0ACB8A320_9AGAM|nr:hypothetical protein BJ138DRAFT_1116531 [Hygrophoropsis aurantiaca]